MAAGVPGVVVLVRRDGRTVQLAGGYSNLEKRTPMRVGDRFRIGSVTKSFVATVVLQLVGEGKLSLDDSIEHWLPGMVPNGDNITIRQLLSHQSGLFDFLNDQRVVKPYLSGNFGYVWTPPKLVAVSTSHPALFAPGAKVSYSNTNYIVLGLIVEAATKDTIQAQLRKRIFGPLGLHSTLPRPRSASLAHTRTATWCKARTCRTFPSSAPHTRGRPVGSCPPLATLRASIALSSADDSSRPTFCKR